MQFIKENVYAAARIIGCSYDELVNALAERIMTGFEIVPLYQDVSLPAPPDGKLCRLNKLGIEQFPRKSRERLGRLVGMGRDQNMCRIIWDRGEDRWSSPELYHKDLVEIIEN